METQNVPQSIVVNIAGDSGDGIQLIGNQFSKSTGLSGNMLSTFSDFPAEIRAPQGTMAGVSGFKIHFSSAHIFTSGDSCDVLVAMNAAALKGQLSTLKRGGLLIANKSGFTANNLRLATYENNPLDDGSLDIYQLVDIDITKLTKEALSESKLGNKDKERAKNMFVLGVLYWIFGRDMQQTVDYFEKKFAHLPEVKKSNVHMLNTGYFFADTYELFQGRQNPVPKADFLPGTYRSVTGNQALAIGLIAAAEQSGLQLFYSTYPITPASDLLHDLSKKKHFNIRTFQAEDEIAAISVAIGASYGGSLGVTGTSGPGMALKTEAIGLAIMLEIPLLICNVQRGGPSTGMPTKTEQSDLMQALYGRNGESPLPVLATSSAKDCFTIALEAARIAIEHMTPVILLSDGYLANSSEVWKVPDVSSLRKITPPYPDETKEKAKNVLPYERDSKCVRSWIVPGMKGKQHRIGGLEKEDKTGHVSYDAENHQKMVHLRRQKIDMIAETIPRAELESHGVAEQGDILVVGWGSTYGAIATVVNKLHKRGVSVGHLHFQYISPMQRGIGELLRKFKHVLVSELNDGQLVYLLRATFLVNCKSLTKIKGVPFTEQELEEGILKLLSA